MKKKLAKMKAMTKRPVKKPPKRVAKPKKWVPRIGEQIYFLATELTAGGLEIQKGRVKFIHFDKKWVRIGGSVPHVSYCRPKTNQGLQELKQVLSELLVDKSLGHIRTARRLFSEAFDVLAAKSELIKVEI